MRLDQSKSKSISSQEKNKNKYKNRKYNGIRKFNNSILSRGSLFFVDNNFQTGLPTQQLLMALFVN